MAMNILKLENVLSKLLVPDNVVIQQATAELREICKDPGIVSALCQLLSESQNVQVRQYAAVLLRRRVVKQWSVQTVQIQHTVRQTLLHVLTKELERVVRNSASQVVGAIATHDLPRNQWPELLNFLREGLTNDNIEYRLVAALVLSKVTANAANQLKPYFRQLLPIISTILDQPDHPLLSFYCIQTLTRLVHTIGTEEEAFIRPLIPKVLTVINALIHHDEDQACESLEFFDELLEIELPVIVPHAKQFVEFCLNIASNENLQNEIRVKCLNFITWISRLKKKTVQKQRLVPSILSTVFKIMCSPIDEDDDDEFLSEAEANTPSTVASQVVDTLSLHMPPDKIIPHLIVYLEPAVKSEDKFQRKAALTAIAVIAEGCADYIRQRYLKELLPVILKSLSDPEKIVRNSALFALGQFSEHLQPTISEYAGDVIPLLLQYLQHTSQQSANLDRFSVTKTYYAVEMFCENLGTGLITYLEPLMTQLILALHTTNNKHVQELAISAIGASASAVQAGIIPYFNSLIENLKVYLCNEISEDKQPLQIQALDTLGVLARAVGLETFQPLARECIELGLNLISDCDDPDLRRCTYGLFASVSNVVKEEMAEFLPQIAAAMISSLQSTDGLTACFASDDDEDGTVLDEFDVESLDGDSITSEDDDQFQGYSIENVYMEEKEDTCNAVGEISINCCISYSPYLNVSFEEIYKIIEYPSGHVRKAGVNCLGKLCCSMFLSMEKSGTSAEDIAVFQKIVSKAIPYLINIVREDIDRLVAMTTVETIHDLIKMAKTTALYNNDLLENIAFMIRDLLQKKMACQDIEGDGDEAQEQEAEYDSMLIEYTGELIPTLASIIGGFSFVPYFTGYLPLLQAKLKPTASAADKSFVIGTIGETVQAMGPAVIPFVQRLYPVFCEMTKDEESEVRSNSMFAIGALAEAAGESLVQQYPHILKMMFDSLSTETNGRVIDNIIAAVCRMITVSSGNGVPLEQVLPMVIQCLPLKEDFEESKTVYSCLAKLYHCGCPQVLQSLPQLLGIFAQGLGTEQIPQDVQQTVVEMVRDISMKYTNDFQKVLAVLPQQSANKLASAAAVQLS